jgi:hypothetical protein
MSRTGNDEWNKIPVKGGELFNFDEASTYIQEPPFFTNLSPEPGPIQPIRGPRAGDGRRQRDHRSHFPRRLDQERRPGRKIS